MKRTQISSRLFGYLYTSLLPATTIIVLIVVSTYQTRPQFFSSTVIDLGARIWLALCFSAGYVIAGNLGKYRSWFYGRKIEDPAEQRDVATRSWNIGMGLAFGFLGSLVTWWSVGVFLPSMKDYSLFFASLNGLILFAPFVIQGSKPVF